jgi:hypothetical protein
MDMAKKSKTENNPSRESESAEQLVSPGGGEPTNQAGNDTNQDAAGSSAPGRDMPAQGAERRYLFTWTEHGVETGHDHPHIAYEAVQRGCNVLDTRSGRPYREKLLADKVISE